MTVLRQVTWGEGLMVEMSRVPGGLRAVVDAVRAQVGVMVGSRNTFAKLYDVTDPSQLASIDQYRAWLMLRTVDQDPREWGLSDKCVPPAVDAERVGVSLMASFAQNTRTSDQKVRGSNPFGCTSG